MQADDIARHRAFGVALVEESGVCVPDGNIGRVMLAAMLLIAAHDAQYIETPRTLENMPRTVEYAYKVLWLVRSKD